MQPLYLNFPDIKPPTVNLAKAIVRGRMVKTAPQKAFEKRIKSDMAITMGKLRRFETCFSRYEHSLACRIVIEIPTKDFYTKTGCIPKRKNDIDNFIKAFIDAVFKNFEEIDDSYILELVALKKESKNGRYNAKLWLEINDLDRPID